MKLSTKVLTSILGITLGFIILILILLFQYSSSVGMASQYVEETHPARVAIEHLLNTIFEDFLLVEQYLFVTQYSDLSQFDQRLSHSQEQCEILTEEVDDLITLEEITNKDAIRSYQTAILVYSSWQRSRDSLMELHKESLATKQIPQTKIRREKERFVELMQNATSLFAQSLDQLNEPNLQMQNNLSSRTKYVQILLIILLVTFLAVSLISAHFLLRRIANPLEEMRKASAEFTKGNYKKRITESKSIVEINSLQQQLNRVYELIDSTFTTKDQKSQASDLLLPTQYKDMLDYIHQSAIKGRAPTIKDLKKHFDITHPTAVSRLKYLEENGYVEIKKQGRNKCIFECK